MSKEKRDRLILTCITIVGILGVLYTFVLGAQKDKLNTLQMQIFGVKDKLSKAERLSRSAETIDTQLAQGRQVLEVREQNMAPPGQYYYWFIKLLDQFRASQRLDTTFILDITQPEFIDVGLLPNFPYKAASFGVRLNGRFDEVGRFIAHLENEFPYMRVQNLRIVPQGANLPTISPGQQAFMPGPDKQGKLLVELRVVALTKPGNT